MIVQPINRELELRRNTMLRAAEIFLLIAGVLALYDVFLMITHRPNPVKGWPLPCPMTMLFLGIGLILFSINGFTA
jgi:hypothetical protein